MDSLLKELLILTASRNASDLHLLAGRFPTIRIDGELVSLIDKAILSNEDIERMVFSILTDQQKAILKKYRDVDFSFSVEDRARFRANVYYQKDTIAAAFRYIPSTIKTIDELNLPPSVHKFTDFRQGLILAVGPAGMGKSTTLASIIDEINHKRAVNIITIEEPIEYVFVSDKALISQREVGRDTVSWRRALKAALREDPDVIMIGEMRDPETIRIALTAAETGHLVISTLHTNSAAETIDRIIDVFPSAQQNQIRLQLAMTLQGIISQRLIPRIQGGRIPACEIMFANAAIRNLIRDQKTYQIDLVIETSLLEGMMTLNRSLATLVRANEISQERAFEFSPNPEELKNLLK
jgi:twitching motility protein PilT